MKKILVNYLRQKKKKKCRNLVLRGFPQRKIFCTEIIKLKPKKPNSAQRSVLKGVIGRWPRLAVHIPGEGHSIIKNSTVLVHGSRVRDLPGVKMRVVRGTGADIGGVSKRISSRSRYGARRS